MTRRATTQSDLARLRLASLLYSSAKPGGCHELVLMELFLDAAESLTKVASAFNFLAHRLPLRPSSRLARTY
ncbi:uncharacterized protein J3R85_015851 [Psidium guajava]|nr:uncharacterized protein J3R85_015851 [Psidium guajava]